MKKITSGQNGTKLGFEGHILGYHVPWKITLEF